MTLRGDLMDPLWTVMVDALAVGCGPRSADQECASGLSPLSTPLGSFLPVALLFACSLLVVACDLLIAPCYGRSLVTYYFALQGELMDFLLDSSLNSTHASNSVLTNLTLAVLQDSGWCARSQFLHSHHCNSQHPLCCKVCL
jgi:hypothetical protein